MHGPPAGQAAAAIHRNPGLEDRIDGRVAGRCAGRAHLQTLHRRSNHDPGRSRGNPAASENPRRVARSGAGSASISSRKKSKKNSTTLSFPTTETRWSKSSATYLQMRNATLAVAESCTGGLLAERITSVSGSSRYFLGGAVVYSNALKTAFADVPASSDRKARRSQQRSCRRAGRRHSQTLRRDPGNRDHGRRRAHRRPPKKNRSAWSSMPWHPKKEPKSWRRKFPGDRKRIRWFASQQALDMVRRKLM